MSEQFDSVVHVAPSAISEALAELGASRVIEFPDLLTHGPVSSEPKRHRKIRLKYWRKLYERVLPGGGEQIEAAIGLLEDGYMSTEQLGSAACHSAGDDHIVIWTTPTYEDRLFLWFVFDALVEQGVSASQMATAEPRIEVLVGDDEQTRYGALRSLELDEIAAGFDELFYPELVYVDAGANLWETFSSASPRQFAISIPHTTKFFPEFPVFAEDYGSLFPADRGRAGGRLDLSDLDADLLGRLDQQEWRTGRDVVDDTLIERYAFLDDLVFLGRLRDWEGADKDAPYVEARRVEEATDIFAQFEYRLTERGFSLLDEGFEPGRKLPIFFAADSRLYAGKKPWVRVVEGDYWWFERFEPAE